MRVAFVFILVFVQQASLFGLQSQPSEFDFDDEENVIQKEYLFGLQQIQQQLNFSLLQLTRTEHDFALNTTNLIINYGENLSKLTNELFARYGFIADIKNLHRFVTNVRARLKFNISRSIRQFSTQKISRMNFKLYQKFLANLYSMLNNHIARIVNAVNTRYDLMECWDSYKAIYLQIGLEATGEISVSMASEIKRLRNDFKVLNQKISFEINRTLKLLDRQHESPFVERLRMTYFIDSNEQKLCEKIDSWFTRAIDSLQLADNNVQSGLQKVIYVAENRFEETFRELVDCIQELEYVE